MWGVLVVLYLSGVATTLQGNDHGEWVHIMAHGGTAHPPGYPLYTLLLRAWNAVAFGLDPVLRANVLSVLIMATAMTVLARALEERNGHPFTTRIATVCVALSPAAWRMAGVAEISALLALNAAVLLWAIHYVENEEELHPGHGALLGAVLGVGVVHHHGLVVMLPLVGWHVVRVHWHAPRRVWAGALLAGAVSGTAVVAAVWGACLAWPADDRAQHFVALGSVNDVWNCILRREYGTFSASAQSGGWLVAPALASLWAVVRAFHLLIPLGLAALQVKRGWPIFLCVLLAGPALQGAFTMVDAQGHLSAAPVDLRQKFYVLPVLLFAVMAHDALASLAYQLPRLRRTVFIRAQAGILFMGMAVGILAALPQSSWRGQDAVERTLRVAVRHAPPGAVVVAGGDTWLFGWPVAEELEGLSTGATVLAWPRSLVGRRPLPATVAATWTALCPPPCQPPRLGQALQAWSRQRPVAFFPAQLIGQVLPATTPAVHGLFAVAGAPAAPLDAQLAGLVAFTRSNPPAVAADNPPTDVERAALGVWAAPWLVLADTAAAAGQTQVAKDAQAYARGTIHRVPP